LIGYCIGFLGLGILISAIIYPLGYLESKKVFYMMTTVGWGLIFVGMLIRPLHKSEKKSPNT